MSTLLLAWRNIFRNKRRTFFTLSAIMIGIMALVLFDGFVRYTLWGLQESTIRNGLGHLQLATAEDYFTTGNFDPFRYLFTDQEAIVNQLQARPEVKNVVPQVTFAATLASAEKSGIVMVQAVPVELSRSLFGFARSWRGGICWRKTVTGFFCAGRGGKDRRPGWRDYDDDGDHQKRRPERRRSGGGRHSHPRLPGTGQYAGILDLPTAMEFLDIDGVPLLITVLEKRVYRCGQSGDYAAV